MSCGAAGPRGSRWSTDGSQAPRVPGEQLLPLVPVPGSTVGAGEQLQLCFFINQGKNPAGNIWICPWWE